MNGCRKSILCLKILNLFSELHGKNGVSRCDVGNAHSEKKTEKIFFVHRPCGKTKTVYEKLVGLVDSNKRPIFQQAITAGAAGTLLGATIKFEDTLGDDELLIGDASKYLQNVVAPVIIESDKNLSNHTVVYSGYTCQEGTLTDDKAFALVSEA